MELPLHATASRGSTPKKDDDAWLPSKTGGLETILRVSIIKQ